MPCSVSKDEEEYYEKQNNKYKYGISELSHRITTRVACELAKVLEREGLIHGLSSVAKKWIAEHKKEDEERK